MNGKRTEGAAIERTWRRDCIERPLKWQEKETRRKERRQPET